MHKDSIVEEVRRAREDHAKKFDYDLKRIVQDLKKIEREEGREVLSFTPRKLEDVQGVG